MVLIAYKTANFQRSRVHIGKLKDLGQHERNKVYADNKQKTCSLTTKNRSLLINLEAKTAQSGWYELPQGPAQPGHRNPL